MADDPKQKAAEAAQEFVKYLVVLSVGALGFAFSILLPTSATITVPIVLVIISAATLAVSVFLGILAYGTLISQVFQNKIDLEDGYLAWQTRGQWISFFLGICVLGSAVFIRTLGASGHQVPVNGPIHPLF